MLVSKILQSKGDDGVLSVSSSATIADAVKILSERRIGTVVISDDGHVPLGILSERDVVRIIATKGAAVLQDCVADHMTKRLVTCERDHTVQQILATMTEKRFRHMPVVENGVMVGIITLGDAVKAQLTELEMEKDALQGMIAGY